jgi:putative peptidoglycan lipid II flippase
VNIALAAALVGPMKGSGVALALTIASAANTALLLFFLGRNPHIAIAGALGPAALYTLKLILFSCIAAVPVVLLAPRLGAFFAGLGGNRLIRYGAPLAVEGFTFAAVGLALLAFTGDRQLKAVLGLFRKRPGNDSVA